jgi:hypothetical protein
MTFIVRIVLCAVIVGTVWLFGEALIASVKRRREKPIPFVLTEWNHNPTTCRLCIIANELRAMESQFQVKR